MDLKKEKRQLDICPTQSNLLFCYAFLLLSDRKTTLLRVTSVRFGHKLEKFITVQTKISSLRKTVMSDKFAMQKCKKSNIIMTKYRF